VRRCVLCKCVVDVVLWVMDGVADDPVPACRSCAEEHGLHVVFSELDVGDPPEHDTCRCCGRELPSPRSWPVTVWVRDGRRLMAVCNACRMEYALQAVFASAPPAGWRVRRGPESVRDEPGT
jgi:hypothetical protein